MLPTQQRFHANYPAAATVDDGLIEKTQLVLGDGLFDQAERGAVVALAFLQSRVEQDEAVLAGFLGQIHRMVGMAQQGVGIAVVSRVQRDADAGRDGNRLFDDGVKRSQLLQYTAQRFFQFSGVFQAAQKQDEFVAAKPCHGVVAAHAFTQTLGNFDQ